MGDAAGDSAAAIWDRALTEASAVLLGDPCTPSKSLTECIDAPHGAGVGTSLAATREALVWALAKTVALERVLDEEKDTRRRVQTQLTVARCALSALHSQRASCDSASRADRLAQQLIAGLSRLDAAEEDLDLRAARQAADLHVLEQLRSERAQMRDAAQVLHDACAFRVSDLEARLAQAARARAAAVEAHEELQAQRAAQARREADAGAVLRAQLAEANAGVTALRDALDSHGLEYAVKEGDAAFYGPKIDIDVRDAIGRSWQLSTIQADFQLPERFDLAYVGADNSRHRPIMLHRALMGSIERFFGVLVEHYAGAFPTWLAPVQVRVLPVATPHEEYAHEVVDRLRSAGARVDMVAADDGLGKRIRNGKVEKLPYVLVVGDDDVAARTVGVNVRADMQSEGAPDVERDVPLDDFVCRFEGEVAEATDAALQA